MLNCIIVASVLEKTSVMPSPTGIVQMKQKVNTTTMILRNVNSAAHGVSVQ